MEQLKNTNRKSKYEMIDMALAHQLVEDQCKQRVPLDILELDISELKSGYVLAQNVEAIDDLPPFRASVMDGYAIKSSLAKVATVLEVVKGKTGFAGQKSQELDSIQYSESQAVYVTTGGPVPSYFDAVIPIEDTDLVDDTHIKINKQMNHGQFVRAKGSDIAKGEVVLEKNQVLKSAEIGLLATVGRITKIKVYKKPVIGLLSTGNELVSADTVDLEDGKIRDSNKLMLKNIINEYQLASQILDYGIVKDNPTDLDEALQKASSECNIIITSGGVSMGELDLVKPYIESKGQVFFGRLNMKPGKPTTFGLINSTFIFALPGNPVSAFVTAHLFVIQAAKILSGQTETQGFQKVNVQLIPRQVRLDRERPEYHRTIAIQDASSGRFYALSTGSQMSSRLLSAKSANCFAILPKAQSEQNDTYTCIGQTQAIIFGQIVTKSSQEIKELIQQFDGQSVKSSCCGCQHGAHDHSSSVQSNASAQQLPSNEEAQFKVGLITVSDRASQNKYPEGDLSGKSMRECCEQFPKFFSITKQEIVSDDKNAIKEQLMSMLDCNLILTSGGTGFFERDVTPEATIEVVEKRADSIVAYLMQESMKIVPTACLSRAIIGMRGKTMIINLPGKPKAVKENFEILMRNNLIIHALAQLKGEEKH